MSEFSSSNADKELTLVSQDGEEYKVSYQSASLSEMIKNTIGDDMDDNEEKRVPLPNVKKDILAKVVEFFALHSAEPMVEIVKPLQNANLHAVVQSPYADYILSLDNDTFYHITLAANYLDIKPLLDLCCARIASLIKDKTVEEIRTNLDIVNDFTPEEQAQVEAENKWAKDL